MLCIQLNIEQTMSFVRCGCFCDDGSVTNGEGDKNSSGSMDGGENSSGLVAYLRTTYVIRNDITDDSISPDQLCY